MSNLKSYFWSFLLMSICLNTKAELPTELPAQNQSVMTWMHLMQYQKSEGGFKSKIKASKFFISPNGAENPLAELKADIELFQKSWPENNLHPQCVFPARYHVLRGLYDLAEPVNCQELRDWKTKYQLSYASLFYAGPYLSSPSSTFGHSFLLLGSEKIEEFSQMTFNFAADIPENIGGFDYAFKGLTGGFPGVISISPYFQRLYQYTDMENRDLWEYRLNLSQSEMNLLTDYVWEIRNQVEFEYYYLNENCASLLLWVLKAVKPEINITTSNKIFVPPSEITQVASRENLVSTVVYHPALLKRLNSKINRMTEIEKEKFQTMITESKIEPEETNPLLLEAMMDHINFERHRNSGRLPEKLKLPERLTLLRRSKIHSEPVLFNKTETPIEPHKSHPPMQLQLARLYNNDSGSSALKFRPGIHGLLDFEAGYLPTSSIKILEVEALLLHDSQLKLLNLTFLNLTNFPTVDLYQSPLSWSVDLSIRQSDFNFNEAQHFAEARFTFGYASKLSLRNIIFYGDLNLGARSNEAGPQGNFELGPRLGFLVSSENFKLNSSTAYLWQSNSTNLISTKVEVQYRIDQTWSVFTDYKLQQIFSQQLRSEQLKTGLYCFF